MEVRCRLNLKCTVKSCPYRNFLRPMLVLLLLISALPFQTHQTFPLKCLKRNTFETMFRTQQQKCRCWESSAFTSLSILLPSPQPHLLIFLSTPVLLSCLSLRKHSEYNACAFSSKNPKWGLCTNRPIVAQNNLEFSLGRAWRKCVALPLPKFMNAVVALMKKVHEKGHESDIRIDFIQKRWM